MRSFLQNNEVSLPFLELIEDEEWKCHFAFTIGIFLKLNELLSNIQGLNLWYSNQYDKILIFEGKLLFFMIVI